MSDQLTKREQIAAMIMQGLVSNLSNNGNITVADAARPGNSKSVGYDTAAVALADALIIELEKPRKQTL